VEVLLLIWEYIRNILTIILAVGGLFFLAVGVVGLYRLPDVYTRLHATTKCDTMGAGLVLLAVAFQSAFPEAVKLIIIAGFIWVTNPTAAHVIAKAAWVTGFPPVKKFDHNYLKGESKK